MGSLELGMFTQGGDDLERAQYQILSGMQSMSREFRHNKLYPGLGELIELTSVLETIQSNRNQYTNLIPRTLTGVDLDRKQLLFDAVPADSGSVERMFELVAWALPAMKVLTEEGVTMFDFVCSNMRIDVVGMIPMYRDEGYAFVPDLRGNVFHVLRYELALFTAQSENYRAMKTIELQTHDITFVHEAPEDLKHRLIKEHRDLPNPATFIMETDLDFPFSETILPVAKRKLMRHLIS